MFGVFKKRKLVGNVPAQIRLPHNKFAIFHYMLYEKGCKRLYEIVFTKNKLLATLYLVDMHCSSSVEDITSKNHKMWYSVIQPWLSGQPLPDIYITDENGKSLACKYID